ncbi:unnamed protein product, partial [Brachionus calyciflorus]
SNSLSDNIGLRSGDRAANESNSMPTSL